MEQQDERSAIAHFYESRADAFVSVRGTLAMHMGYYTGAEDPATIAEATDRLVRLVGRRLGLGPGHRLLDVGCGAGQPALLLAEETGCFVAGVDASPGMIATGRRQAAASAAGDRAEFHHAKATDLPFPDRSFDRALMLEVTSHLPDTARDGKQAALAEAARCLEPGGLLALVDMVVPPAAPKAGSLMEKVPSVHLSTRRRLRELLAAVGFDVLDVTDISAHTRHSARRSQAAFDSRRRELAAAFGDDTVEEMAQLIGQLAEADQCLGYVVAIARAGQQDNRYARGGAGGGGG
ncbi:methyltransferase domain-containing protein [Streptomyces albus subsp. chlorinus]|uniref:class I SAM-dependent methyltransferase n=1 Tax=Streptomyces albus TaxID=1888 RepID=UPI00156D674B|nr:class I SAM-dependent methyltransferase [Streptomyces albus]NSC19863.1 methyltransferase domain-containing protein [Streptomyces albus subsp. chlorinus]